MERVRQNMARSINVGVALAVLALVSGAPVAASTLSDAADALSPGQSVVITTDLVYDDLYMSGANATIGNYSNMGGWDPINNEARYIGKGGGSSPWGFIIFDEATNTWTSTENDSNATPSGIIVGGHSYSTNATDYSTGYHYVMDYVGDAQHTFYEWNGSAWSTEGTTVNYYPDGCCEALTYFPGKGLVWTHTAAVTVWNGSSWRVIADPSPDFGYSSTATYQKNAELLIFGRGTTVFKMNAAETITQLGTASVSIGNNVTDAIVTGDPGSSNDVIVHQKRTTNWWKWDVVTDTWTGLSQRSASNPTVPAIGVPPISGGSQSPFAIPIDEYDIIMYVLDTDPPVVWLYKHSEDTIACVDGIDNDGDGMIDGEDPSCSLPLASDDDEDDPGSAFETACKDSNVIRCYGFEDEDDLFTGNTQTSNCLGARRMDVAGGCTTGGASSPSDVALCGGLPTDSPGTCAGGVDEGDYCDVNADCAANDCLQCNGLDLTIKSTGKSSLRFETPDGSGANNSGSASIPLSDDWSYFLAPTGETPGGGGATHTDELWIQFKERMNTAMVSTLWDKADSASYTAWKSFIWGNGDTSTSTNAGSCDTGAMVLQQSTIYPTEYGWTMYDHDCGGATYEFHNTMDVTGQPAAPWNCNQANTIILQQVAECCYPYSEGPYSGCAAPAADKWYTHTVHIVMAGWGATSGNLVEAWVQPDGGSAVKWLDSAITYPAGARFTGSTGDQMAKLWLTKYITEKEASTAHSVGYSYFDDLLFSTSDPRLTNYSTTFSTTENPISESGIWVNGGTDGLDWHDVQTGSGNAYGADFVSDTGNARYSDPIAHLDTSFLTFGADQYAEGVVHRAGGYSPGALHEIELLLRFEITANSARGYEMLWTHAGDLVIVRWNGPLANYTELANAGNIGAAVDGDLVRFEISGSNMTVTVNDVVELTTSDSTWTDGQPGIGFWPLPGATLSSFGWQSFAAGGENTCGDGRIAPSETCDDGSQAVNDCAYGDSPPLTQVCNEFCSGYTDCANEQYCGDDSINGSELCDGADLAGNDCTTIGQSFNGGLLACAVLCDGWVTTGCRYWEQVGVGSFGGASK